jgi:hypothetical protein
MQWNAVERNVTQDTRPCHTSTDHTPPHLVPMKFFHTQRGNKKPHQNMAGPGNKRTAWEKSGGPYAKGGTSCAPMVLEPVIHVK